MNLIWKTEMKKKEVIINELRKIMNQEFIKLTESM